MSDTESPSSNGESSATATSLGTRMLNVFVSPSEVFDEVKHSPPQMANWLVPLILAIIVGIIFTMIVFSQPQILQNLKEAQEKQMQEMVNKGKLTQQQADQALTMSEKFISPPVLKVFGILMTIFANALKLFFIALLLWLIANFAFKVQVDYSKMLEITGLVITITVLDVIIRMLLAVIYGNPSMSLGPILLISHFNPQNKIHVLLAWLDVFLFWEIGLWSLGLSRLTGRSFLRSFIWLFSCLAVIAGTFVGAMMLLTKMLAGLGGK